MFYFILFLFFLFLFFFFQAEDGIRDYKVTGVQTCALPIWLCIHPYCRLNGCRGLESNQRSNAIMQAAAGVFGSPGTHADGPRGLSRLRIDRSEERRVGKECRSRWWPDH